MKKNQSGFSLLEALIGIALASMMGVVFSNMQSDSARNIKEQNTAQYHKQVMNAAAAWIKDNYVTVQAASTATTPHKLTVATLIADNYLPSGFQSVNPYNQATCVLTLEPTANKLETLVLSEGGANILQGRVPTIANLIGASGGYVTPAGNVAQGSYGGWSRNITNYITQNCSGTASGANKVAGALFLDGDNLANDYLYRNAVPGNPGANTMTTPLLISHTKVVGDACTTTGAITTAADGTLLTCQGGSYQQQGSAYWKNPVANFAALPTCNASAVWQTRIVQTPTVGSGPRAYTCNGTSWSPITTDDNGNLTVAGTGTITGNLTVGGNTTLGNASTDTVTIPGNASINQLSGNLEVTSVAAEGSGCSPNGRVARDSNGLLLSCQSGIWKRSSKSLNPSSISVSTGSFGIVPLCTSISETTDPSKLGFSRTFTASDTGLLQVSGSVEGLGDGTGFHSSFVSIYVDGNKCAVDRSTGNNSSAIFYASASCSQSISSGTHTATVCWTYQNISPAYRNAYAGIALLQ